VTAAPGAYPKVLQLGDRWVADIWEGEVEVTEKLDGSQIGFGMVDGTLVVRSHGRVIHDAREGVVCDDKMFWSAVDAIESVAALLPPEGFYYGECLDKPKQSTIAYERVPSGHVALFGARRSDGTWLGYDDLAAHAAAFGFDVVPLILRGSGGVEMLNGFLERDSYLGGSKIEGVVIKRFIPEGWMWMGLPAYVKAAKYVSEKFKETHKDSWSRTNTARGGIEPLMEAYRTEARWRKAVQHLRERGEFHGRVQDIGSFIREVGKDLVDEEEVAIRDALWSLFRGDFVREASRGAVDWFKGALATGEFGDDQDGDV
jgi:hypothetical protein